MRWRSILVGQPRNQKYRSWKLPLKGVSSLQWKCKSSDYDVEMMKWTSCIHFLPFSCWTVESILKHIFCITTFFIVLQKKTIGCCFGMLKVCHRDVKVVLKHVYSSCRVNNLSYFLFKMVWATLVQIEDQNPVSSAKHKCVTCSVLDWLAVRKPESSALSESIAHAAPSYNETVRKPAAKTSRQTADYLPAGLNSKSRSAKSYTRSTTNLLSRKVNNIIMMLACTLSIIQNHLLSQNIKMKVIMCYYPLNGPVNELYPPSASNSLQYKSATKSLVRKLKKKGLLEEFHKQMVKSVKDEHCVMLP